MPPIFLFLRKISCVCANCPLFQRIGLQKMPELYILCLEGGLVPDWARKMDCAVLLWIFSSNKSLPANRMIVFYVTRLNLRYFCIKRIRPLNKNSSLNEKKNKMFSCWCPMYHSQKDLICPGGTFKEAMSHAQARLFLGIIILSHISPSEHQQSAFSISI
jgi:hypothetical protein